MSVRSSRSRRSHANPPEDDIAASLSGMTLADKLKESERRRERGGSIYTSHRSGRDDNQSRASSSRHSQYDSQSRASSSRHTEHAPPPSAYENSSKRGPAQRPPRSHRPPPLAFENSSRHGTGGSSRGPAPPSSSSWRSYAGSQAPSPPSTGVEFPPVSPSHAPTERSSRSRAPSKVGSLAPSHSAHSRAPSGAGSQAPSHSAYSRAPSGAGSKAPSRSDYSRAPSGAGSRAPSRSAYDGDDSDGEKTIVPEDSISCAPSRASTRATSRAHSSRHSHAPSRARSPPPSAYENPSSGALVRRASSRAPSSRHGHAPSRARSPPPSAYENPSSGALVRRSSSRAPSSRYSQAPSSSSRYPEYEDSLISCGSGMTSEFDEYDYPPTHLDLGPRRTGRGMAQYESSEVVVCPDHMGRGPAVISSTTYGYTDESGATYESMNIECHRPGVAYGPRDRRRFGR